MWVRYVDDTFVLPRMWVRYVDDTFVLWPHKEDELDTFHQHLNSQHPSIQFTMEKESEGKISFLDVQIERKEGKLSTRVYRKITHTDRYINYASHHHPKTKTGVIACLRNRAEKVCDQQSLESELSHLKKTFRANGYPPSLISQGLHREPPQPTQSNTNNQENQDQKGDLPPICATNIRAHTANLQTDRSQGSV